MLAETADLQRERWSDPPGSRWLTYLRPSNAFAVSAHAGRPMATSPMNVARFALDGSVPPLLKDTVSVAETARCYVQGVYGKRFDRAASSAFSGKDEDGVPKSGHGHAFFLPTDEDGDGRLDHLTVYSRDGFAPERELAVLDGFSHMHGPGGTELHLVLLGTSGGGDSDGCPAPVLARASRWRSVTPFVPTRHHKRRGAKRDACSPEDFAGVVLREEIARRSLPEPVSMRRLKRCELWRHGERVGVAGRSMSWIEFRRERLRGGGRRGSDPGAGFEIEFPEPVQGPIALGYACHYGLGLFAPVDRG